MQTKIIILAVGTALASVACSSTPYNPNYEQTTQYKNSDPYAVSTTQLAQNVPTQAPAPVIQQASYPTTTYQTYQGATPQPVAYVVESPSTSAIAYEPPAGTYTRINAKCFGEEAVGSSIQDCEPQSVVVSKAAIVTPAYPSATSTQPTLPASNVVVYADSATATVVEDDSMSTSGTPGYHALHGDTRVVEEPISLVALSASMNMKEQNGGLVQGPASYSYDSNPVKASYDVGGDYINYTIQPGNTVYSLARETCVTIDELKALNGINDNFYIRIGDQIKLPSGRCIIE